MSFWNYDNLRGILGGTWLARPQGEPAALPDGATIDSRAVRRGQIFMALAGARADGHRFLAQAAAGGSPMAVIDAPGCLPGGVAGLPKGMGVLHVAETRRALGLLAGAYRKTLTGTRVIAVTGSNGKTTTTRLIDAVLGRKLRGSASIRSFNNAIGVPLTILGARRGDQYLVCEVGTSAPGEIAGLAEIVGPDIGVIVSIGREHLEFLGSVRGVCQEAASLFRYLRPGGFGVVTADAPGLADFVKGVPNLVTFGFAEGANLRITGAEATLDGLTFSLNGRAAFSAPLLGRHNASNAAAAVAVGRRMRLDDEDIGAALANVRGAEMRLERLSVGGVELLNDAYNANPESMLAGLRTLAEVGAGARRRVAVIGDMLELGPASDEAHREIGEAILKSRAIDLAVLVGPLARHAADVLRRDWPPDRVLALDDLDGGRAAEIASALRPGDVVLLKASRRMGLERVARALADGAGRGGRAHAEVKTVGAPTPARPA